MAGTVDIQSLKDKRGEIHGLIAAYQAQIAQAKHVLAHINASIRLFTDPEHQRARYMVSHGFFKKGEIADICLRHLEIDGEMTTRDLSRAGDVRAQAGCNGHDCSGTRLSSRSSKPCVMRRDVSWFAWSRSAKGCVTGWPATPLR